MKQLSKFSSRINHWKAPLLSFAVGQPVLQLVNLLTGLLLLRWMSIEHYAQFGVAFAFQSTVCMLADLGFSSSILALAGEKARDPEVLGRYVRSARHFRFWLALGVGTTFAISFPLITREQPWDATTKIAILASILLAVAVQAWSMYQAPLLAHRRVAHVYRSQIAAGVMRLVSCGCLYALSSLSGIAASWIGTLTLGISGWWIKRNAKPFVREPVKSDSVANREMLRYLAPLMPGVIFTAFQSQISIAIITIFGSTQNIAEVAALGRLGQLFGILSALNGMIIAPYIAALPESKLLGRYFLLFGGSCIIAMGATIVSFMFPPALLMLLGPHYQNLGSAVGWTVLTSCLTYLSNFLWTMHSARRWVYWWNTVFYICAILAIQTLGTLVLPLQSTMGVVYFGLFTSGAVFLTQLTLVPQVFKTTKV